MERFFAYGKANSWCFWNRAESIEITLFGSLEKLEIVNMLWMRVIGCT
ncbi:Uncharacterised protein [uncultured archaeon]|nr:Uncharacterised protein [uncultured archaeon]